jgi:hypothetical protein
MVLKATIIFSILMTLFNISCSNRLGYVEYRFNKNGEIQLVKDNIAFVKNVEKIYLMTLNDLINSYNDKFDLIALNNFNIILSDQLMIISKSGNIIEIKVDDIKIDSSCNITMELFEKKNNWNKKISFDSSEVNFSLNSKFKKMSSTGIEIVDERCFINKFTILNNEPIKKSMLNKCE